MINTIIKEDNNDISVLTYIPNFFTSDEVTSIKTELDNIDEWKESLTYDGTKIQRKQKWYQKDNQPFCNKWQVQHDKWQSHNYTPFLTKLQEDLENNITKYLLNHKSIQQPKFNSLLINYYQNGDNFIAPHQDNKFSFGKKPTIALLSFGETREFILERTFKNTCKRNKDKEHYNKTFNLEDNSLFIMSGCVQQYFCHSIKKDITKILPRYSLTFRQFI